jgi:hypothetical protein
MPGESGKGTGWAAMTGTPDESTSYATGSTAAARRPRHGSADSTYHTWIDRTMNRILIGLLFLAMLPLRKTPLRMQDIRLRPDVTEQIARLLHSNRPERFLDEWRLTTAGLESTLDRSDIAPEFDKDRFICDLVAAHRETALYVIESLSAVGMVDGGRRAAACRSRRQAQAVWCRRRCLLR